MLRLAAHQLFSRAAELTPSDRPLPWWTPLLVLANAIVVLPILFLVLYTVNHIYPVLAIVEDKNPPAYEPLSLDPETPSGDDGAAPAVNKLPTLVPGRPVTSSIRGISRLLKSHGGCAANFRGFFCAVAQCFATAFLFCIFAAIFPYRLASVATLLAALSLVQLSTAWVHIVITPRSSLHFWQRLPPFRTAFKATARIICLYWLAEEVGEVLPMIIHAITGVPTPQKRFGSVIEFSADPSMRWTQVFAVLAGTLVSLALLIPLNIILVRVQASLLPVEQDAIVPFDRSFGGKVVPAVVGGKGYATMSEVWSTFSRSDLRRLLVLYAKIFVINVALVALLVGIFVPQMILLGVKPNKPQ